ncbi:chaperone NapD [Zestomonas carbonaria]|uniref:Chaperone NapD n=1 Tax=Zestomonas carbonaria TaxID=2762745 RepID=A0A7U7EK07_9GAMM|nr:chaperone NapD [Pseudomonas carbonaria]CAD5106469.1 Chaperone NapD [Pseudomonas carbonaria]
MPESLQIASLIVHVRPELLAAVKANLRRLPGLELHQESPQGKLVVVLEVEREAQILDRLTAIQGLPGVLAANLVYHEVLEEPDAPHRRVADVPAGEA